MVSSVIKAGWLAVLIVWPVGSSCTAQSTMTRPSGDELARTHCSSCHLFPEPDLLDRSSWETVLPYMGGRLGIYATHSRDSLITMTAGPGVDADSLYPITSDISTEDWNAIVAYYLREAPDVVEAQDPTPPLTVGLPGFRIRSPNQRFNPPMTTLAEIQEDQNVLIVGNHAQTGTVIVIGGMNELLFSWQLDGAPMATHWDEGRLLILLAGRNMAPTDLSDGSLQVVESPQAPVRPLITGLRRPVDMDFADLNGDGRQDIVICEFGNQTGFLSWYEDIGEGYRRHVLSNQPGAASAEVRDLNGDGLLDIGVLMAQGDEGIDIYLNEGGGQFERTRILRFPPTYGSNHIEFADFNGDGQVDILYVNGDNADITPILKGYHGIRIFLGGRDGTFEEAFFYPLHGAVAAEAADFDQDGDLDIAAISYFPDYADAPEKSFVLLRNNGDLTFDPYTFEDAHRGRWLRMDVGDFDGDQDLDIMLGSNISFGPVGDRSGLFERWVKEGPSVVILENTGALDENRELD